MTTNPNSTVKSIQGNTPGLLVCNFRQTRISMLRPTCLALVVALLTVYCFSPTLGQEVRKDGAEKAQSVTASVISDGVRISAPSSVSQLRLEIYDGAGQKLHYTEQSGGNLLDWHFQGNAGERVADGTYLLVVTSKNPGGQLTQKLGLVTVSGQTATIRPAAVSELSPQQAQVVGPIEGEAESVAVVPAENALPVTVLAHTGDEAQVTRSRGAFTFRLGDFFGGRDREQMRLTEDGRLGIGTDHPEATLDVAGSIRAREGFSFADGSRLNVNESGTLSLTSSSGNIVPNVAGSGSNNRLTKWADGSGTLADSLLGETAIGVELRSPNVGSGVNPSFINPNNVPSFSQLMAYPSSGQNANQSFAVVPRGTGVTNNRAQLSLFNTDVNADAINYEFAALRARGPDFLFGTGKSGTGLNRPIMFASGFLSDNVTNNGQLYLAPNGNVGIGTTNPGTRLDVAGSLKLSGAGSSLTFPDGTSMTTAASGGGTMSGTSIVNAVNDAATTGTINDNRLSPNVARLNSANTFNGNQTVNGDISTSGPTAQLNVAGGAIINCGNVAAPCLNVENNTLMVQPSTKNVGIGVGAFPQGKLSVGGTVQSTTGGFVFPDGSTQTSAAGRGYATVATADLEIVPRGSGSNTEVAQLNLRPGNYLMTATVQFQNTANFFAQDNTRQVRCIFFPISQTEPSWLVRLGGVGSGAELLTMTFTTVITPRGSTPYDVELLCNVLDGGFDRSYVFVKARRLTAVRMGELEQQ